MPKNPAAVSLGSLGGKARAAKLTPQRRREIAQAAGKRASEVRKARETASGSRNSPAKEAVSE